MRLAFTPSTTQADGGWAPLFARLWPAYRRWYLKEGVAARPTYTECRRALHTHMPEMRAGLGAPGASVPAAATSRRAS